VADEPLLQTQNLTRRFGALAAVNRVSLAFEPGRVHAVIGPNGAGKSTFLNLLSGELRATGGQIRFRGEDVTRATPDRLSRMGIGRSYQTANLFPLLSCSDCVWLAAQSRLTSSMLFFRPAERYAEVGVRAARALEACGLSGRSGAIAGQLSYGEQRQLEIAMMLATDPTLLLLDEPLAGLGHDEALRIVDLLRKVARGRTVILVEHDMEAVFSISDVVTVMVDGRVLVTGSPAEIRASAAVREAYLGEELA
jgi:branched-chain amino acid transport system ATP-binding protein